MSIESMVVITVTIPLGWAGFIFTLWKWDARRYERKASEELKNSEERGKERIHELQLTSKTNAAQHRNELEAMRARVDSQEQTLLRVQHTITMRVMKALNESTIAEEELREAVQTSFLDLTQQTSEGFAELRTDYTLLLSKIVDIAEQNTGVSRMLKEFQGEVESYYERLHTKLRTIEPQALSLESTQILDASN